MLYCHFDLKSLFLRHQFTVIVKGLTSVLSCTAGGSVYSRGCLVIQNPQFFTSPSSCYPSERELSRRVRSYLPHSTKHCQTVPTLCFPCLCYSSHNLCTALTAHPLTGFHWMFSEFVFILPPGQQCLEAEIRSVLPLASQRPMVLTQHIMSAHVRSTYDALPCMCHAPSRHCLKHGH